MKSTRDPNKRAYEDFIISRRHTSLLGVGCIGLLFVVFATGYCIGKKEGLTLACQSLQDDALDDQITASLYALSCAPQHTLPGPDQPEVCEPKPTEIAVNDPAPQVADAHSDQSSAPDNKQYYAQLIGFGKKETALKFVQRLQDKAIPVNMKTRMSKTAKGKAIAWYQVVTQPYTDRSELEQLVSRIEKQEKISGSRIRPC